MKRVLVGLVVAAVLLAAATPHAAARGLKRKRGHGVAAAGCGDCAPACTYREEQRTVYRCVPVWTDKEITETVCVPKYSTETRTCTVYQCNWQDKEVQQTVCVPKVRTEERTVCVLKPATEERQVTCYQPVTVKVACAAPSCGGCGGCGDCAPIVRYCTKLVPVTKTVQVCVMKPEQQKVNVNVCYYVTKTQTVTVKVPVMKPVQKEYQVQVCHLETQQRTRTVKVCSYKQVAEQITVRVPVCAPAPACGGCCN
jgi:hypothetical protein